MAKSCSRLDAGFDPAFAGLNAIAEFLQIAGAGLTRLSGFLQIIAVESEDRRRRIGSCSGLPLSRTRTSFTGEKQVIDLVLAAAAQNLRMGNDGKLADGRKGIRSGGPSLTRQ